MIETDFGGGWQGLAAANLLGSRQKDLFLHRDVLEKARPELSVGFAIDLPWKGDSLLEQAFQAPVVVGKKAVYGAGHNLSQLICRSPQAMT
jgi:hypothetical protein